MKAPSCHAGTTVVAVLALMSSVSTFALAQSPDPSRTLANNDALFIDGRTFSMTPGASKGDASAQITKLGARELGAGAIIFRIGDKLYIADSAPVSRSAMLIYNPGNIDCSRAASDPTCLPAAALRDSDIERQRPQGLRDQDNSRQAQLDYERQRPLGLRDTDNSRQAQLDYERQRPLGLRDTDNSRQAQLDYERQRPRGLRDEDSSRQAQLDYERQRPLGLRDQDSSRQAQLDYERQRPRGLHDVYVDDPDYSYYRLKKAFEEAWTPAQK